MKKLIVLLPLLLLFSCEGPAGPQGPIGPRGPEGVAGPPGNGEGQEVVGQGFEVTANFDQSNNYGQIFAFPDDLEVLDDDIVVVYLQFEIDEETGNKVWQQLPASIFFEDGGEMQYAFDHTVADVQIFLQGDIDLGTLGEVYTQNQIFRVAVLPVDYVESNKIDLSNFKEVEKAMQGSKFERLKSK